MAVFGSTEEPYDLFVPFLDQVTKGHLKGSVALCEAGAGEIV